MPDYAHKRRRVTLCTNCTKPKRKKTNFLASTDGQEIMDLIIAEQLAQDAALLAEGLTAQWVYTMRVYQLQDDSIQEPWGEHSTTDLHTSFSLPADVCNNCGGEIDDHDGDDDMEPVTTVPFTANGKQNLVQ
jgi:hypothetical protein